jgi:folate-binding protein YgfZ
MDKNSLLHEIHERQGVDFTTHQGCDLPSCFASPDLEYAAIKDHAGLLDLSWHKVIEVSGRDRVRFLHGMVTNDIKALKAGEGCYAAMLNAQGKMLADMHLYCLPDTFLCIAGCDLAGKIVANLRKYIIADQVTVQDQSEQFSVLGVQGPGSFGFLRSLGTMPDSVDLFNHFWAEIAGMEICICAVDRTGRGGFDFVVPSQNLVELWNFLAEVGKKANVHPAGFTALNLHRIEAGISWYGVDVEESNLPIEARMESAISYKKGCYLGQEIIARATYRGHLNRKLLGVVLDGVEPATKGDKILFAEKEAGWATSNIFSPALQKPVMMGYLRREAWEPGTKVRVEHQGRIIEGEVMELPFVGR